MDPVGTKFGQGPRELGGSVDLIKQCKLWPHHKLLCRGPMPTEISDTLYIHNVVGQTKIKKGEGMELDQLIQKTSAENRHKDFYPFDLGILMESFKMRETTPIDLSYVDQGTGTQIFKVNGDSEDNTKHEIGKTRVKDKSNDHKRIHHQKSRITNDVRKTKDGHHNIDPHNLQKQQDKKRKFEGGEDLSNIQRRQKTELKNMKIKNSGTMRIIH